MSRRAPSILNPRYVANPHMCKVSWSSASPCCHRHHTPPFSPLILQVEGATLATLRQASDGGHDSFECGGNGCAQKALGGAACVLLGCTHGLRDLAELKQAPGLSGPDLCNPGRCILSTTQKARAICANKPKVQEIDRCMSASASAESDSSSGGSARGGSSGCCAFASGKCKKENIRKVAHNALVEPTVTDDGYAIRCRHRS